MIARSKIRQVILCVILTYYTIYTIYTIYNLNSAQSNYSNCTALINFLNAFLDSSERLTTQPLLTPLF